jgi:hypothetical protein
MDIVSNVDRSRRHAVRVVAAALAVAITTGMFWVVIGLFQSLGLPLAIAAAERDCPERACVAQTKACTPKDSAGRNARVGGRQIRRNVVEIDRLRMRSARWSSRHL